MWAVVQWNQEKLMRSLTFDIVLTWSSYQVDHHLVLICSKVTSAPLLSACSCWIHSNFYCISMFLFKLNSLPYTREEKRPVPVAGWIPFDTFHPAKFYCQFCHQSLCVLLASFKLHRVTQTTAAHSRLFCSCVPQKSFFISWLSWLETAVLIYFSTAAIDMLVVKKMHVSDLKPMFTAPCYTTTWS